MKILVVGGAGMIGGHAALHLQSLGHEVAIGGRSRPQSTTALAQLPFIQGDYVEGSFAPEALGQFEAIVFAAGNDIRHRPKDADFDAHCLRANAEGVPRFARMARDAGVKRFVNVGSFYPHIAPQLKETNVYIRSRQLAVDGLFDLAGPDFLVCSLDAPFVVGVVPGMSLPMFETYTRYAEGALEGMPVFGPAGGTNFISTQSLSEAIAAALERGEQKVAYLVGDENLSFAEYFELFFRAAGNEAPVPSLDQEHPLLPDVAIYTGRGNTVAYEPDPRHMALLGYRRGDVARAVRELVDQYRSAA
jgi:nucleoside-diphosphate-sugar epimerase